MWKKLGISSLKPSLVEKVSNEGKYFESGANSFFSSIWGGKRTKPVGKQLKPIKNCGEIVNNLK